MDHLYLQLVVGLDFPPERRGERQQAPLVHVETAVLVAADDVDGEGRPVPGRVSVRHQELEDAAADRLALLHDTPGKVNYTPEENYLNTPAGLSPPWRIVR